MNKRWLSAFIAVMMVLCLVPVASAAGTVEGYEFSTADIAFGPGKTAEDFNFTDEEDGVNVSAAWGYVPENALELEFTPCNGETFTVGNNYYLQLTITPVAGWTLGENFQVTCDGPTSYPEEIAEDGSKAVVYVFIGSVSEGGEVDVVEGYEFSTYDIGFGPGMFPEGITIEDYGQGADLTAIWGTLNETDDFTPVSDEEEFAEDTLYYLYVTLTAAEGHDLSEEIILMVDGAPITPDREVIENAAHFLVPIGRINQGGETLTEIELVAVTDEVILAADTDLNEGYPVSAETEEEGIVTFYQWMELTEDGYKATDDAVPAADKDYYLLVAATCMNGYIFADTVTATLGSREQQMEIDEDGMASAYFHFTLSEAVELVDFQDLPAEIEVGGTPVTTITPVEGSHFTVKAVKWHLWDSGIAQEHTGAFEEGKLYTLSATLEPEAGYYFNEDTAVPFKVFAFEPTADGRSAELVLDYDTFVALDEVTVGSIPEFKTGVTADELDAESPVDAKYMVITRWEVWNPEAMEWQYMDQTNLDMEDGFSYKRTIGIAGIDGYKVTGDTQVKGAEGFYYDGEALVRDDHYFPGQKAITALDLTLTQVEAGESGGQARSAGTGTYWTVTDRKGAPITGTVALDEHYGAFAIQLLPEEGYYFAENITVKLDGETITLNEHFVNEYKIMQIAHDYDASAGDDDKDDGAETDDVPKTGETAAAAIALRTVVVLVMMAAVFLLVSRKRTNN